MVSTIVAPEVRELGPDEAQQWTNFVTGHAEANLYHTLLWRDFVQEAFGHQPIYLLAETDGRVTGVLPMFLIRRVLLGSKLVSMPYDIGSGGPLAADESSERTLVERAMNLARELGVNYLELRCRSQHPALEELALQRREPVVISEMELHSEAQAWAGIRPKHRQAVRWAQKCGVAIRQAESLEDFCEFQRVYLRVFRNFGTPPYGARYVSALWRRLHPAGMARVLLAYQGPRCLGGALLFCWGRNLICKLALTLPEAHALRANKALFWRVIEFGLALGFRRLNWGSSSLDQTGLVEFKQSWGAQSFPAVFYQLPVCRSIPAIEQYYDSTGLARRIWRRLPIGLTPTIGGMLNRWFC